MTTTVTTADLVAALPDEVVTKALVQDVRLPGRAGVMALVTLDNGHDHTKPNTFGPATMLGFQAAFDTLAQRVAQGEVQAVGITGKPFIFAVGADLTGVGKLTRREEGEAIARAGHTAYATLMDLPVPTFAFVNGAAMGGGVELALACDYRTMSAGVPAIALPECFLGLVPGWGGCYSLPNLIGVRHALTMIIDNPMNNNKMLKGPQAYELGLADVLLEPARCSGNSPSWPAAVC